MTGKETWASWVIYTFEILELSDTYASGKTYIHIQIHSRDSRTHFLLLLKIVNSQGCVSSVHVYSPNGYISF